MGAVIEKLADEARNRFVAYDGPSVLDDSQEGFNYYTVYSPVRELLRDLDPSLLGELDLEIEREDPPFDQVYTCFDETSSSSEILKGLREAVIVQRIMSDDDGTISRMAERHEEAYTVHF